MSTTAPLDLLPPHSAPDQLERGIDRRSSSLSEIVDSAGHEAFERINPEDDDISDANETEAETERLDDSPFQRRNRQNVLLMSRDTENLPSRSLLLSKTRSDQSQSPSDASSSSCSSIDDTHPGSAIYSPRKRKRSFLDDTSEIGAGLASSPPGDISPLSGSVSPNSRHHTRLPSDDGHRSSHDPSVNDVPDNIREASDRLELLHEKRKSRRKLEQSEAILVGTEHAEHAEEEHGDSGEAADSNGDDGEGDEAGDVDIGTATKSHEEVAKKKSALDSLISLENYFAKMRDKLFDERLKAANRELALLQTPQFVHQELLAMKEAVDRHRQQKITYQQTLLKYKLQALQRESVANRHQIQSQYMQTVREIRDKSLDQLNKEFYQVQRERRIGDGDIPDAMYLFSNDRARQIKQQTAYNTEVSILAGVAKYTGFPAAPSIKKARPKELEEDLRSMGIAPQPPPFIQNKFPSFRANPSAGGSVNRPTPTAEENFIERNAWANPQHPANQQRLQLHRQASRFSQPPNPTPTPIAQGDGFDTVKRSGSTVAEQSAAAFALNHSTPLNAESGRRGRASPFSISQGETVRQNTPSKASTPLNEHLARRVDADQPPSSQNRISNINQPPRRSPLLRPQTDISRDSPPANPLHKPAPSKQSTGSHASPTMPPSMKMEEGQRRPLSAAPHQFARSSPTISAGNGQV